MRGGRPSLTARWLAAHRARLARTRPSTPGAEVEGERRLYHDVAGRFAVPLGRSSGIADRTRAVDAEVARAIGRGTRQVVLLGAGYDARALRFGGGAVRFFEVDLPAVLADKRRRLAALGTHPSAVAYVAADLMAADLGAALGAAGHDRDAPSLFVCENAFSSLTLEAAASVCAAARARASKGSVLVAGFVVAPEPDGPARAVRATAGALLRAAGEPRRNELRPGDPEKLMVVTGWRVAHSASSAESRLGGGSRVQVVVCDPAAAR